MKVYVLMKWEFDYERDFLVDVFKKESDAINRAKELAEEKIINRKDKKVVKAFNSEGNHYGYIVRWFDEVANDVECTEPWENEWMFYVREKEVK